MGSLAGRSKIEALALPQIAQAACCWNENLSGSNPGLEFEKRGEVRLARIEALFGRRMAENMKTCRWRNYFEEIAAMAIAIAHGRIFVRHAVGTAIETARSVLWRDGFRIHGDDASWLAEFANAVQAMDGAKASILLHKAYTPPLRSVG